MFTVTSNAVRKAALTLLGAALILGLATALANAAFAARAHTDPPGMVGDPAAAATYWHQQTLDDCGLMAAAAVVGQVTGREVAEPEIIAVAQTLPSHVHAGPVYAAPADVADANRTGRGTHPRDLPTVLARYGIGAAFTAGGGLDALERYLAGGHKIIVGVNAELIWGLPVESTDGYGNPAADHAVVVTGVDTATRQVHLSDSGTPFGKDETVAIEAFAKSWAASGDSMIVTQR
ncbi:C39 family peptidase [Mycobacterium sp. 1423905.2]|uniref:C39 family peptidase n=1 Tax=Mycobacterium sp. 1423905.2 TaxID=1856859 RepID=UPI00080107B3|nr:C39 family peptidase [Mycobacterium sp. 1423905.2]OBJ47933.1 hypothetical protein A9W95_00415 [Mycobacterium sp. 1423905.2]